MNSELCPKCALWIDPTSSIPHFCISSAAQKDLQDWRNAIRGKRNQPPPNYRATDPAARASMRYLNLLTAGWTYPHGKVPLIHWSRP